MSKTKNTAGGGRVPLVLNVALFMTGVIVFAFAINVLASREGLRSRMDATATRAFSLSEQTTTLLDSLKGEWTIAVVLDEEEVDRDNLRHMNEVLRRFDESSEHLSVARINPSDPADLSRYEELLTKLRSVDREDREEYDLQLEAGFRLVELLPPFVAEQQTWIAQCAAALPDRDVVRTQLEEFLQFIAMFGEELTQMRVAVTGALKVGINRPIADYDYARSVMIRGLTKWSRDLDEIAIHLRAWGARTDLPGDLTRRFRDMHPQYDSYAQAMFGHADALKRLPELELQILGSEVQHGQLAMVIGPERAAILPIENLLPAHTVRMDSRGGMRIDQRFRGEQLFAATIRSLSLGQMPMVVFMHSGDRPRTEPNDTQSDLRVMRAILKRTRYEVHEWRVEHDDKPEPAEGQPAVWILAPTAPSRQTMDPRNTAVVQRKNFALRDAAMELIAAGEPVMLSLYPVNAIDARTRDFWEPLAGAFGLRIDTSAVIYQADLDSSGERVVRPTVEIIDYPLDHAVAHAVNGLPTVFTWPMPIEEMDGVPDIHRTVIASVPAAQNRWIQRAGQPPKSLEQVTDDDRFDDEIAIAFAATRMVEGVEQRFLAVGSTVWMLDSINLQYGITTPGNQELMLASVAWLAGMDEMILQSPASQQVARLQGIDATDRLIWGAGPGLVMPVVILLSGIVVWIVRRR